LSIVGDPPNPVSLYMFSILILVAGIVDFISPEKHLGTFLLTIGGLGFILIYFIFRNDEYNLEPPTIKEFVIGCGLLTISAITYFVPWLRLTSLVLIGFGAYTSGVWIWIFWEIHFGKEKGKN